MRIAARVSFLKRARAQRFRLDLRKITLCQPTGGETAFTLIEIMIAIAIFGMVMIAIYSSWSAILRGSKVGLDAAAEVQRTRIAMRALEESLASVEFHMANLAYYAFIADTSKSKDFAYLSFVARLPASFPGSGLFGDQVLRRVSFAVEQGTNGAPQLVLRQSPLLEATEKVGERYPIILVKNISLFALEFWDTRTADWVPEWTYTNQLPKLVKVGLGFGKTQQYSSQPQDVTVRVISLAATAIPLAYQGGSGAGPGPGGLLPGQNPRAPGQAEVNPGVAMPIGPGGFGPGGYIPGNRPGLPVQPGPYNVPQRSKP